MVNYTDVYGNVPARIDRSVQFMDTTAPPGKAIEHSLRVGDALFTPSSETAEDIGWAAVVTEDLPGVVYSYHLARWRPSVVVDLDFLRYALNSDLVRSQLTRAAKGTTRQILTRDDFRSVRIALPSRRVQGVIADYLAARVVRIDATVERNRKLAALLAERRSSALSEAFAGASTRITKLKHLLAQPPSYGVLVPRFADDGVPFIRVNDLFAVARGDQPKLAIERDQSVQYERTVVRAGDVLLSVVGSVDKVAVVPDNLARANIARAVCRLVPRAEVPGEVLELWLQTREYLDQAAVSTSGDTAQPTLNMSDLANFEVRFPLLEDMDSFRRSIAAELRPLKEACAVASRQIDLLLERRQALITAAVTGQLEIPGVAA